MEQEAREQVRRDAPRESKSAVRITVEGFEVTSASVTVEELSDAAWEIAADIGSALSSLGTSALHGSVTITVDGVTGDSDDD